MSRAKMFSWMAGAISGISLTPSNPADTKRKGELANEAEKKLRDLIFIASEAGWHVDANLEYARELIAEYDETWRPVRVAVPSVGTETPEATK